MVFTRSTMGRAFNANWLREKLFNSEIGSVILPKPNRKFPSEFDKYG